jgi:hypothetical protein
VARGWRSKHAREGAFPPGTGCRWSRYRPRAAPPPCERREAVRRGPISRSGTVTQVQLADGKTCPNRAKRWSRDPIHPANPISLTVTSEATGSSSAPWAASRSAIALFLMAAPASRNRSGVTPGRDSCPIAAWPFRGQSALETAPSSRSPVSSRRAVPESSSAVEPSIRSPSLTVKRPRLTGRLRHFVPLQPRAMRDVRVTVAGQAEVPTCCKPAMGGSGGSAGSVIPLPVTGEEAA